MSRVWQCKPKIYCMFTYRLDQSSLLIYCLTRGVQLGPTGIAKMGKIPRKSGSAARKRKRYTMQMKHTVYAWRKFKNMRLTDIQKECKETFNLHVADTPRDDLTHM